MEEKFKYIFDRIRGILYKYYYGSITFDDIFSSWDYRNASLENLLKEYWRIPDYYQKHIDIFGNKRIAVITQKPKDTVVPALVETKDEGYLSRPFYSMDAAIEWVLGES